MNESPLAWKTFGPAVARSWTAFFEAPADRRTLSFLRVTYATVILINALHWAPDLKLWFGESGVMPATTAWELQPSWTPNIFRLLPTGDTTLYVCYGLLLIQATLLLFNVRPRLQAIGVFVWLLAFQSRNPLLWDSEDDVMRLVGLWMIFLPLNRVGPAKTSAAADSNQTDPNHVAPAWALRLLQIQICLVFFDTFLSKIQGEAWLNGTAVYYAMRLDDFARLWAIPNVLVDTPWIVRLTTWSVLVIEGAAPLLVWFKETRRPVLLCVLLFHLGCIAMMHLFLFHWIMLCGWSAFLTTEDWNSLDRGWKRLKSRFSTVRSTPAASATRPPHSEAAEEELVATKMLLTDPDRPACFLPW